MATRKINKYKRHTKKFRKHRGGASKSAAAMRAQSAAALRAAMASGKSAEVKPDTFTHTTGTSTAHTSAHPISSGQSQRPPPPFKPPIVSNAFASNKKAAAAASALASAAENSKVSAPIVVIEGKAVSSQNLTSLENAQRRAASAAMRARGPPNRPPPTPQSLGLRPPEGPPPTGPPSQYYK